MRGQILERFGWTEKYMNWGIPWLNIYLMMIDQPYYEPAEDTPPQNGADMAEGAESDKAKALSNFLNSF